ncbi:c-type cytochrome domain-containing protein [Oligoflexus tunisiensis]|uniref:c-type cytochrome domain-containing protein n=1 Tax=Oligoflexus tunisiensis TaxID=708132 RepID=UPI00114D3B44|nr:c-type cytochrome domain-containing protein [Oligoflexus tunisiensis]
MIIRNVATCVALILIVSCKAKKKSVSELDAEQPMVTLGSGPLPPTLMETGLFKDGDLAALSPGLHRYDVRVPLWSDGAQKDRFVFAPTDKAVSFNGTKLDFPTGSVFVKHFKSDNDPGLNVETRVIVLNGDGTWVYGTYLWKEDGSTELLDRARTVQVGGKDYRIPSPKECTTCHRENAEVLGFSLEQLNRDNQIQQLSELKVLGPDVQSMLAVKPLDDVKDKALPINSRARTYMHVNCATCHNPGGPKGANLMDMRLEAVDTHLLSLGKIFPGKPDDSILFQKISADTSRMPPVSIRPDPLALEIFRSYIEGLVETPAPVTDEPVQIPEPQPGRDVPAEESQNDEVQQSGP